MKYQKATAETIQFDSSDILVEEGSLNVGTGIVNVNVHWCDGLKPSYVSVDIGPGSGNGDTSVDLNICKWVPSGGSNW